MSISCEGSMTGSAPCFLLLLSPTLSGPSATDLCSLTVAAPRMGNQTRPYNANEVYVTGTFDDWGKTVRLDRNGEVFEKEVELPATEEKIQYKVRTFFRSLSLALPCPTSFPPISPFSYCPITRDGLFLHRAAEDYVLG